MTPLAVTVEFLPDGRCVIEHGSPAGSGFRCPLPYDALGKVPIELRVVLPSGAAPAERTFPRLEWRQSGHDWIGTASLPAAPSFVSLGQAPAPIARDSFGWNFYGFFVFAALFILVYFAWARTMQRRTVAAR